MSRVKPMGLIESMSGKVCRHSNVYFFRRNGKTEAIRHFTAFGVARLVFAQINLED